MLDTTYSRTWLTRLNPIVQTLKVNKVCTNTFTCCMWVEPKHKRQTVCDRWRRKVDLKCFLLYSFNWKLLKNLNAYHMFNVGNMWYVGLFLRSWWSPHLEAPRPRCQEQDCHWAQGCWPAHCQSSCWTPHLLLDHPCHCHCRCLRSLTSQLQHKLLHTDELAAAATSGVSSPVPFSPR